MVHLCRCGAAGEIKPDAPLCGFVIPGRPVPWARARAYVKGEGQSIGFATAQAQRAFKRVVQDYGRVAMLQAGVRRLLDAEVWLSVRVYLDVPKSWKRTEPAKFAVAMEGGRCLERPDMDNWIKLPMDALQGIIYADDGQVQGFPYSGKWFDDARPRLEVDVWGVEP